MIFVIAGLAAAYGSAGKMIGGYLSTADWVTIPVAIHSFELKKNYGETTTYSIKANYSYQYAGKSYTNDRVSLSSGSDNIGKYWQDLYASLQHDQSINEISVFVNPDNPNESVLDRTFRWKTVIFGSMFLLLFCGIGGAVTWISLRTAPSNEERLRIERFNGIPSDQRKSHWLIGGFGSLFFIFGASFSAIILPDAIEDGEYGALFVLLFLAIGIVIMGYGIKSFRSYRRFGATPLMLNPAPPCIGGQFGGSFTINLSKQRSATPPSASQPSATALLQCSKKTRSNDNSHRSLIWQEETDVFLQHTANGYLGEVLFDIPRDLPASEALSARKSITWHLEIDGDFGAELGKLERRWAIEISEEADAGAGAKNSSITIPEFFQENSDKAASHRAKTSALKQIPLTEDNEYIHLASKASRHLGSKIGGLVFGCIFTGTGVFTVMQDWWPGYIFILIGVMVAIASLYKLGKSIEVRIDKNTALLHTRVSWMGMTYSRKQIRIQDASQFKIKKTSTTQTGNQFTEYYVLSFKADPKTICLAEAIEGKKAAEALKQALIERLDENAIVNRAA